VTTTVITKLNSFTLDDGEGKSIPFEVLNKEIMDPGLIDRQIVHYGNYDPFFQYTIQLQDSIPAMGYKTYFVVDAESHMGNTLVEKDTVETDYYVISVNPNGTLKIYDKELEKEFDQVLRLENGGDDGDEYDFSPLADETLIYSDNVQAEVKLAQNVYEAQINITVRLDVPGDLEKRKNDTVDRFVDVHWKVRIPNHQPILKVEVEIDNQAKDHRLRILIPTGIASSFSVADNQFGFIKRDVYDSAMDYWKEEGWDERPDSIYPMLSFAGLSDNEHGVSVLTNSTREFEIVGDSYDTIAITLFRSVGVLGKEEMLRRPGRPSGIKLPTPDSQMLGKLELDFAITTHKRSATTANIGRIAKEFTTPIVTYNKIPHNAMKLNPSGIKTPVNFSFLQETNNAAVLSTLKKAENEDRFVLRIFNPTETEGLGSFNVNLSVDHAQEGNLNEKPIAPLSLENNNIKVHLKPNPVKTVLF
jgi:mannosylglycerate hydrolase